MAAKRDGATSLAMQWEARPEASSRSGSKPWSAPMSATRDDQGTSSAIVRSLFLPWCSGISIMG